RIEGLTSTSITIYKSTVVVIGPEEGLALARQAVDMIAGGAEHGTVLSFLERTTRKNRLERRSLETIELREEGQDSTGFENLVPGLGLARERRHRRFRAAQVDPEDEEAVEALMDLAEDEAVTWEEE
ncbi:MAG: hypothetical protein VYB36_00600, partial [Candidatus Thermoplasmatota archaeon]|nr:hypothetical protein [Candidatus Thermoplasmatota archaeon]